MVFVVASAFRRDSFRRDSRFNMRNAKGRVFHSAGVEDTVAIGLEIGAKLKDNYIVGLIGELGAGKTVIARGIVRAFLGIGDDPVRSPTFAIMNVYSSGEKKVYHFDLYRIKDMNDLESTGYREFSASGGVSLVEWPDRLKEVLEDCDIIVEIREGEDGNSRVISVR